MSKSTIYLIIAIVMAVIAGASLSCAYKCQNKPLKERVDTLVVYDTIRLEKPKEIAAIPQGYELVPCGMVDELQDKVGELVMLADSLEQHPQVIVRDSLIYISVPLEQRIYEAEEYKAAVSGYKPSLDWIEIYERSEVIAPVPDERRWGLGISVGYGFTNQGISPFVGVGVSYNLFRW